MDDKQPMIAVDHLTKKFGDFTAVDDISFSLARGEIFAFLGPNGAGKTTTIKMLTTLLHPTNGSMRLAGHDPVTDKQEARKAFGIVFQDPSLDDELTALENMDLHAALYRVGDTVSRERISTLLTMVDLADRKNDIVKRFSGGMKRRLEIARALIHDPRIVFFDEPTIGLDPQTRNHIWEYLRALNAKEQTTIFFTTHYMEEAERMAGRIAIIDRGKIIALGSAQELKANANAQNLEEAFLKFTGSTIRPDEASGIDQLRMGRKLWGR